MGGQNIYSMFTSSNFRKSSNDKVNSSSCDDLVNDVLAEYVPNEADKAKRTVRMCLSSAPKDLCCTRRENKLPNKSNKAECIVEESFPIENIKEESKDPAMSASAGWQAVKSEDKAEPDCDGRVDNCFNSEGKSDFELHPDGSFPFYILDAYEKVSSPNIVTIYLFGKVKSRSAYCSCCVIVKNMQRCVYAVPKGSIFQNDVVRTLEEDAKKSHMSVANFRAKLQDMATELKNELAKHLLDLNVSTYCMTPVKRNYAFERLDVPTGQNYFVKINYPFQDAPLPSDLKGENFCAVLGTHCSALELFLIKRKIKGPSWLSVSNLSFSPAAPRVTWCKFEATVNSPKHIRLLSSKNAVEIPPLVVTSINLKSMINEKEKKNEIVSASIICRDGPIDNPVLTSQCTGRLNHFTVVRFPEGSKTPMVARQVEDKIAMGKLNVIVEVNERALLSRLVTELYKLDSDIFVGHNISGFDLDLLLNRAKACKLPSTVWSKIGRLKRSSMPNLTKGNAIFGSGASPGVMSCVAGRLLCDTFLSSRDLLKEVSYSLTELAKTQLNKDRKEIYLHDISRMFQSSVSLFQLVECGETDAWLSMELMFHLNVLPLTRQLTNISGNLWGKTLQGARAQRVEYLLLHAFHARKYIVPDKIPHGKAAKFEKRKIIGDPGSSDLNIDYADFENNSSSHQKRKKGPTYSGGLVLDPKCGLYDKFVLVLDFNSLYPSIIQEYNICFTTVERSVDGLIPPLPSNQINGVLPELLKDLVERRKMVKKWLKSASDLKARQYEVQQQALKLTANSMYGCLGFSNSRFYAKPLAELITLQGREILQNTADLVQNNLNLEVIYGDTDSIMIYCGLNDITKANEIARRVIQEVNKKYRKLEIDVDGFYKRMLLLKKKKYAAVKVLFKDGAPYEVIERKGLDMVRRDWSPLSKDLGDFCLAQILSGSSCEEVVESIHDSLRKIHDDMKKGLVALEKYIITKSLTKPLEAYPDKNQPHVQVALRLKQNGSTSGCCEGDTVPYIICCEQGNSASSTGMAYRARHPDELKQDRGLWMIDIDYYLSQQIHPVVSRLCASIQGTSPARLADCLGLDSSKFKSRTDATRNDESNALLAVDESERYQGCKALILTCPSCRNRFECLPMHTSLSSSIKDKSGELQAKVSMPSFWHKLRCLRCPMEKAIWVKFPLH